MGFNSGFKGLTRRTQLVCGRVSGGQNLAISYK